MPEEIRPQGPLASLTLEELKEGLELSRRHEPEGRSIFRALVEIELALRGVNPFRTSLALSGPEFDRLQSFTVRAMEELAKLDFSGAKPAPVVPARLSYELCPSCGERAEECRCGAAEAHRRELGP